MSWRSKLWISQSQTCQLFPPFLEWDRVCGQVCHIRDRPAHTPCSYAFYCTKTWETQFHLPRDCNFVHNPSTPHTLMSWWQWSSWRCLARCSVTNDVKNAESNKALAWVTRPLGITTWIWTSLRKLVCHLTRTNGLPTHKEDYQAPCTLETLSSSHLDECQHAAMCDVVCGIFCFSEERNTY